MRITFVLPAANLSGGIRVVAIHAERLQKRGHQVFVVSTPPPQPTLTRKVKSFLRGRGWPTTPKREASHFDNLDMDHRVIERYRPVIAADVPNADVVVATWWETAEWVWRLPPSKGAKVHFIQDYEVWAHPAERVDAVWRLPTTKIVISKWLADLALERFGDRNATLVPNSVDCEQFHAPPRGKQSIPTVGLMYVTIKHKGLDTSLAAFRLAARQAPGLRLMAFGLEQQHPDLQLPINSQYVMNPEQHKIRDIYASCDAWLFGSRMEGFGLPILEAMACRTPVIGTPAGAAPELLDQGGGILVKHEDPQTMADAIIRIAQMSEPQWQTMSTAAHNTASRHSWEKATDLFERALENASKRTP